MAKTLEKAGKKTHVAEVVHHGEQITLPEKMSIPDAIKTLQRREAYLQEEVQVSETFPVFPHDGAFALSQVMRERYGWQEGKPIHSFFGTTKPTIMKVPTGPGVTADVPWGRFSLPNIDGWIQCGADRDSKGRWIFQLHALCRRKHEDDIRLLFEAVRKYLKDGSIYQGQAIKIRFKDSEGDYLPLPEPEFIDTRKTNVNGLIFADKLMAQINASLFVPISRIADFAANNIKIKRGVLLGGKYGTGKTLAASVAAALAVQERVTFVYCQRADELADALDFAKQYQTPGAVVFCEDIDRETDGERSVEMDDILNILDGVDTKHDRIITVVTTNHLENINQAMVRPGRLDDTIDITPPDAKAAEKLVRLYGGKAIDEKEDLNEVGAALNGQIPAVIEEVVKRAKLFQLALLPRGSIVKGIGAEALLQSAESMTKQIELLRDKPKAQVVTIDHLVAKAVRGA